MSPASIRPVARRRHGDVLIELMEFAIQWRKANNLPTSAK